MPFFEMESGEDGLPLITSDVIAADVEQSGDDNAARIVVASEPNNEQESSSDDSAGTAQEETDDDNEAAAAPGSSEGRNGATQAEPAVRTPRSAGRKRKAADVGLSESTTTRAARGKRPVRAIVATVATSARLAAKMASKPVRGRPSAAKATTSAARPRGRPKKDVNAPAPQSKRASKGRGGKPRSNQSADEVPAGEWEVEKILDSGIDADTSEHKYLVKWKGYSDEDNTWEPKSNLAHCMELVKNFEAHQPRRPKKAALDGSNGTEKAPAKKRGRKAKA